jgi:hypothetical protein
MVAMALGLACIINVYLPSHCLAASIEEDEIHDEDSVAGGWRGIRGFCVLILGG